MFNNMKNKIHEKTGTDLPKLIAAYNGKVRSNHHSRQSSISSVSSLASDQGCKEDGEKANPVGRLSRQAGEEGVERRNIEKTNAELQKKVLELEKEKKSLQATVEKVCKERDSVAEELKELTDKSSEEELLKLKTRHETLQRQFTLLEEGNKQLEAKHEEAIHNEKEKRTELNIEVNHLKEEVERLTSLLEEERDVKEKTIFRNAQISQQAQLTDQQLDKQRELNEELSKRVSTLEEKLDLSQKSIKNLQLKLADLKKTLQEEIKSKDNCSLSPANGSFVSTVSNDDINFKYLKHVLMKFLTSSECEAQHLTRVVSMLLHMTPEEERLLQETLQCRMSWFSLRSRAKSRRTR